MPAKFGAGQLIERIAFDKRVEVDDGYGNVTGEFSEQFQHNAEFVHLRGSETVMAGRLESRATFIMRVRACADTMQVTSEWRIRDSRRNVAYNIRDITEDKSRALLDLLVESGVAA